MLTIGRCIAAIFTKGQQKSLLPSTAHSKQIIFISSKYFSSSSSPSHKKELPPALQTSQIRGIAAHRLNQIAKLLVQYLFPIWEPSNKSRFDTTSIDRALKYSAAMSPRAESEERQVDQDESQASSPKNKDVESKGDHDTHQISDTNLVGKTNLTTADDIQIVASLQDQETGKTFESLSGAYAEAAKKDSSIWLDFGDKKCFIYLYRGGGQPSDTLAAFDLDGTLIKPKSNKRIPRNATDWDFFSVWTKTKLQQCLREKEARFVIFTNQNGVGLQIVAWDEVKHRIELVTKRLDIPCTVFVAIDRDVFRKPRTGMFHLFYKSFNDSQQVDLSKSFYCGDAIGYPSHSDADIKFAQRLGLSFLTPDKFVRGVKPKPVA